MIMIIFICLISTLRSVSICILLVCLHVFLLFNIRLDIIKAQLFVTCMFMVSDTNEYASVENKVDSFIRHCITLLGTLPGVEKESHLSAQISLFRRAQSHKLLAKFYSQILSSKLLLDTILSGCTPSVFFACQEALDTMLKSKKSVAERIIRSYLTDQKHLDILSMHLAFMTTPTYVNTETGESKPKVSSSLPAPPPVRGSSRQRVPSSKISDGVEGGMHDSRSLNKPPIIGATQGNLPKMTSTSAFINLIIAADRKMKKGEIEIDDVVSREGKKRQYSKIECSVETKEESEQYIGELKIPLQLSHSLGKSNVELLNSAAGGSGDIDLLQATEKVISSMGVEFVKQEGLNLIGCLSLYASCIYDDDICANSILNLVTLLPMEMRDDYLLQITFCPERFMIEDLSESVRNKLTSVLCYSDSLLGVHVLRNLLALQIEMNIKNSTRVLAILSAVVEAHLLYDEETWEALNDAMAGLFDLLTRMTSQDEELMGRFTNTLSQLILSRQAYALKWAQTFITGFFGRSERHSLIADRPEGLLLVRHVMFCAFEAYPSECLAEVKRNIEAVRAHSSPENAMDVVEAVKTEQNTNGEKGMDTKSRSNRGSMTPVELTQVELLDLFHIMMLCEQEASLSHAYHDENDVEKVKLSRRSCPLDESVLLSLDVLRFQRGVIRRMGLRERTKNPKTEFVFLEDSTDQTPYILEAARTIEGVFCISPILSSFSLLFILLILRIPVEIAASFPSLWMRYIPFLLQTLQHSKLTFETESKRHLDEVARDETDDKGSAVGTNTTVGVGDRYVSSSNNNNNNGVSTAVPAAPVAAGGSGGMIRRPMTRESSKTVDATFHDSLTGILVMAKVGFRFYGDGKFDV